MNWKSALIAALVAIPLIAILALGFGRDPHAVPSVLEGKPAPAFALTSLEGQTLTSAELRGRPIVLNFWASWCQPCMVEHEALQAAAQRFKDQVHFIGIVYQDTAQGARDYLKRRTNVFPQLLDDKTAVAIDYGVAGVPESFFIDRKGVVRKKHVGVLTSGILESELSALLSEAP